MNTLKSIFLKKIDLVLTLLIIFSGSFLALRNLASVLNGNKLIPFFIGILIALTGYGGLKKKRETRINFLLAFYTSLIVLWVADFIVSRKLEYGWSIARSVKAAKNAGLPFDERTIREAVLDLRKEGKDAVPSIGPGNYLKKKISLNGRRILPLAGIADAYTVGCHENGSYINYQSDELGLINPHGITQQKNVDLMAIGDSFAAGSCVEPSKSFVGLLRKKYSVINVAFGGNGPLLELATLQEYGSHFRPKRVVWFYFEGNDLLDLYGERKDEILMHYLTDHSFKQDLISHHKEINSILRRTAVEEFLNTDLENSRGKKLKYIWKILNLAHLRLVLGMQDSQSSKTTESQLPLFYKVIEAAKNVTESWGGRFYFVYLPWWDRFGSGKALQDRDGQPFKLKDSILEELRSRKIEVVDVTAVFEKNTDPLENFIFRQPNHYNEIGHLRVFNHVSCVLQKNATPCFD